MPGFDITSILDFKPPRYICPLCRGLFREFKWIQEDPEDVWSRVQHCPICVSKFVLSESAPKYNNSPHHFLKQEKFTVELGPDALEHARSMASLIRQATRPQYSWEKPWPLMRLMFEVLARARHFVYFSTWGMSHLMIGAFKMASVNVPVLGVVSNVEEHAKVELTAYPDEAPQLTVQVVQPGPGAWDAPHQKLVVVDGMVAFTGSTNLTNNAIRKADRGLDISEVVTDVDKVLRLSNQYFSPSWKRLTAPGEKEIVMWDPPF
ncbi:Phospholipase D Active site motif-containing protein [Micromonospora pattaloongensis]|uniref:Phospholipase D Active site motif-containing protein n=1 Tax=Micromonospora pattaloongensis TaxID=405436 RepID=A0A1H3T9K6_9ACTN|nr:hypothetical protein [Micromonospora pattaloongensis]SDZ46521.1 Phospholipase D Active site motif-containing protein [Micromonospora pattaloongensis]